MLLFRGVIATSGVAPNQNKDYDLQYFLQTTFRGFLSTLAEVVQTEAGPVSDLKLRQEAADGIQVVTYFG